MFKRVLDLFVIVCFLGTTLGPLPVHADPVLNLPTPGTMVNLSPAYEPMLIKGLTVHKDNPFLFDFIVDTGNSGLIGNDIKMEGDRLVRYFLACLTIPEKDLWVNLSPYEKDRMVPQALGQTALGRDLLAEDYILKQLTASLIYPEKDLGKAFWDRVYAKARLMYGTTQVPVNTFNKVWIMADKATVYEHGQSVFVIDGHLKVMLEEDYLALQKHGIASPLASSNDTHSIGANIVKQIILPEIEKEVNTGKNFAALRQIFNSLILASWYKKNLKEVLLNQVYADKSTVNGVKRPYGGGVGNLSPEEIYEQYLKAYKKGVFNYIKDTDRPNGVSGPRKYFSGGFLVGKGFNPAIDTNQTPGSQAMVSRAFERSGRIFSLSTAMFSNPEAPNPVMQNETIAQSWAHEASNRAMTANIENMVGALHSAYGSGETDEFVKPIVLVDRDNRPVGRIKDDDVVFTFNFRRDRMNQITAAFAGMAGKLSVKVRNLKLIKMFFDENQAPNEQLVFPPKPVKNNLGEWLSLRGLRQYRTAETEKFNHVTRFFNGGSSMAANEGEDRILVPSPKVATYDLQPEMSAQEVTDRLVGAIEADGHDFYVVNFAQPDMVGHTGKLEAAIKAVAQTSKNVGEVVRAAREKGLNVLIIADHGNVDQMQEKNGSPHTRHTTSPVPFIFIPSKDAIKAGEPVLNTHFGDRPAGLSDVAPTILKTLGQPQPVEMTGKNLVEGYEFSGRQKTILIIMDGLAINPNREDPSDAVRLASERGLTPDLDKLFQQELSIKLEASGTAVGLPEGQFGNSEVGHRIIGAGRILEDQPLTLVNDAIKNGSYFKNEALLDGMRQAKETGKAFHMLGLVSNGGVHSSMEHIYATLEMAKQQGLSQVYIHAILDGRDTDPKSAEKFLRELQAKIDQIGIGQVVDMVGRYYPMDRDNNWERTAVGYDLYADGKADATWQDAAMTASAIEEREVLGSLIYTLRTTVMDSQRRIKILSVFTPKEAGVAQTLIERALGQEFKGPPNGASLNFPEGDISGYKFSILRKGNDFIIFPYAPNEDEVLKNLQGLLIKEMRRIFSSNPKMMAEAELNKIPYMEPKDRLAYLVSMPVPDLMKLKRRLNGAAERNLEEHNVVDTGFHNRLTATVHSIDAEITRQLSPAMVVHAQKRVIKIIADVIERDPESISMDDLLEDLGVDSADRVVLATALEAEFGIENTGKTDDLLSGNEVTIGKIVRFVEENGSRAMTTDITVTFNNGHKATDRELRDQISLIKENLARKVYLWEGKDKPANLLLINSGENLKRRVWKDSVWDGIYSELQTRLKHWDLSYSKVLFTSVEPRKGNFQQRLVFDGYQNRSLDEMEHFRSALIEALDGIERELPLVSKINQTNPLEMIIFYPWRTGLKLANLKETLNGKAFKTANSEASLKFNGTEIIADYAGIRIQSKASRGKIVDIYTLDLQQYVDVDKSKMTLNGKVSLRNFNVIFGPRMSNFVNAAKAVAGFLRGTIGRPREISFTGSGDFNFKYNDPRWESSAIGSRVISSVLRMTYSGGESFVIHVQGDVLEMQVSGPVESGLLLDQMYGSLDRLFNPASKAMTTAVEIYNNEITIKVRKDYEPENIGSTVAEVTFWHRKNPQPFMEGLFLRPINEKPGAIAQILVSRMANVVINLNNPSSQFSVLKNLLNPLSFMGSGDWAMAGLAASKSPAWVQGGIDLNTSNGMQWKDSKDGKGVEMNIDPAMVARIRREGISSLSPVIFKITPVASIWPLVGLQAPAVK